MSKARDRLMTGPDDADVTTTDHMFRMTSGKEIKDDKEWSASYDLAYGVSRHPEKRNLSAIFRKWDKEFYGDDR